MRRITRCVLMLLCFELAVIAPEATRRYRNWRADEAFMRRWGPGSVHFMRLKTDHGWHWFKVVLKEPTQ